MYLVQLFVRSPYLNFAQRHSNQKPRNFHSEVSVELLGRFKLLLWPR